jgi:hypothetical protein
MCPAPMSDGFEPPHGVADFKAPCAVTVRYRREVYATFFEFVQYRLPHTHEVPACTVGITVHRHIT